MLVPNRTGVTAVGRNDIRAWAARIPPDAAAVTALTALAAALRFATLTSQSYWYDEAATVNLLHSSLGAMLRGVANQESTPPLYYLLAWGWARVFGFGEAGLRSLSALAGTAVVPISYLCGRELVSRRAGLLAGALAAVSPFMIWYSQEARSYMLLAALCGLSLLFFARAWHDPSRHSLGWWSGLSALALLAHFFAGFLVAPEALALLWRARSRWALGAVGAVAAVQLALVPLVVGDASHRLQGWIRSFPLAIRIDQVPVALGLGTLYQDTAAAVDYGLIAAAVLSGCVIVLLVIGAEGPQLRGAGLAAAVGGFVVLAPLVLALLGADYYLARNLMPAWIPLAVLLGAACTAPRTTVPGAALALVLLGAFVWGQVKISGDPAYQRPDYGGVAGVLARAPNTRAVVAENGTFDSSPLSLYLAGTTRPHDGSQPVTVAEVDIVGAPWQTPNPRLPAGTRLIASRLVPGYLVERFALAPAWRATATAIGQRAAGLIALPAESPAVLIQRRAESF
jgi:mannosyltransferase